MVKPRDRAGELLGEDDAAGGRVVELEHGCARLAFAEGLGVALPTGSSVLRGASPCEGWVGGVEEGEPFGELERGLEAVGEARLDAFADDDAVDDDLDVMLVLLVERGGVLDRVELRRRCGRG